MTATTVASGEINMPSKFNLIYHVAKVKAATSADSMADAIPFFSKYNIPFESNASKKTQRKIYIIHIKENIFRNISRTSLFQQLYANKYPRLRDSVPIVIWPSGGLGLVTDKKTKNKTRAEQEPRSAHGRAVKKCRNKSDEISENAVKEQPYILHDSFYWTFPSIPCVLIVAGNSMAISDFPKQATQR